MLIHKNAKDTVIRISVVPINFALLARTCYLCSSLSSHYILNVVLQFKLILEHFNIPTGILQIGHIYCSKENINPYHQHPESNVVQLQACEISLQC